MGPKQTGRERSKETHADADTNAILSHLCKTKSLSPRHAWGPDQGRVAISPAPGHERTELDREQMAQAPTTRHVYITRTHCRLVPHLVPWAKSYGTVNYHVYQPRFVMPFFRFGGLNALIEQWTRPTPP